MNAFFGGGKLLGKLLVLERHDRETVLVNQETCLVNAAGAFSETESIKRVEEKRRGEMVRLAITVQGMGRFR